MTERKTHQLKLSRVYFDAVADGSKPFEIREFDRDYVAGDLLELAEVSLKVPDRGGRSFYEPTGRITVKRITYVFRGGHLGVDADSCVLGLAEWKP